MKRRILAMLLVVCVCAGMVVCPIAGESAVYAEENAVDAVGMQSGDFGYSLADDGTVSITGYKGEETSVEIPAALEGKPVTSIGEYAFEDCSSLASITIPDSVTSIGECAFWGCSSLTSITIPDSVTSIGGYAFADCSGLTSITIPNSVTSIGERTLRGCSSLTSITIPDSVTSIGSDAFADCSSLISITIPDSVTSIGDGAFSCSSLISITIPNSVTSIESKAFEECSSLTSITIPDSVTSIGNNAFLRCSSLSSITIPNSVTSIGEAAFIGCSSLTSITIPDSVTSIGDSVFSYCDALNDIYYAGSEEQWAAIDNQAELNESVTIHYAIGGNPITPVTISKAAISTITNTNNGIEITWNPVTNAAAYDIYRRIPNNDWTKIATVNSNVTKYVDVSVKSNNGTMYGYRIQAVNKEIKGEYSDEKTICCLSTPKLSSAKNNKKGKVTVKWNKAAKINGYEVCCSTDKNFKKATIKKAKASQKSYVINKLKKKKTYYIRIRTYKKEGSTVYYSAWSSQKKVKIKK